MAKDVLTAHEKKLKAEFESNGDCFICEAEAMMSGDHRRRCKECLNTDKDFEFTMPPIAIPITTVIAVSGANLSNDCKSLRARRMVNLMPKLLFSTLIFVCDPFAVQDATRLLSWLIAAMAIQNRSEIMDFLERISR